MRPAVDALAGRFHVISYSLLGERMSGPSPRAFDSHLDQVDDALDRAAVERAIVCGVSYGGLIAVRYAARRAERVDKLVLVSTPAPGWQPDSRARNYANAPRRSAIAFVTGAPGRLSREIAAAVPGRAARWATLAAYLRSIVIHPTSPGRMAARVKCVTGQDFIADAKRVTAPTLVITGEASLDRVVPVQGTMEYLDLISGAVGVTLERTGHIGLVTRPAAFAELIGRWCGEPEQSGL